MTEDIQKILELAVWAPSGDNSQPWKFKIDANVLEIHYTPNVDHPILNFNDSGSFIAHGALIENIVLIAKERGLATSVGLFPDTSNKNITARLFFQKGNEEKDTLVNFIKARHTNRKSYKNTILTSSQKDELLSVNRNFNTGKVKLIEDVKKRKTIGRIGSLMEEIALQTKELHRLFFKSIIWNRKESLDGKKGLYIKTLELPLPIQKLFKFLKYWPFQKFMNMIGFYKMAALTNASVYASGSAIGIISIPKLTSENFIETGRIMQRFWLTATKLNLSLQPVTGLMFLAQRIEANDKNIFSDQQVKDIEKSMEIVRGEFNMKKSEFPVIMFRIGVAMPPTDRTGRRSPELV